VKRFLVLLMVGVMLIHPTRPVLVSTVTPVAPVTMMMERK
jgi:hypothetical protein